MNTRIVTTAAALILTSTLFAQQATGDKTNNWRAEHSRDNFNSSNVKIDTGRGLETTGTPAKAAWDRAFATEGTYSFRIKYNPMPARDMTLSINGTDISTKGMNAKGGSDQDIDCDKAVWRTIADIKFKKGSNTLVATPTTPTGKLPHICQFEAILK